jgi:hypothetical protein
MHAKNAPQKAEFAEYKPDINIYSHLELSVS